jgi:hypothetical protein
MSRRFGAVPPPSTPVRDPIESPPVADWLAFLAELLAAEFLREVRQGGDRE